LERALLAGGGRGGRGGFRSAAVRGVRTAGVGFVVGGGAPPRRRRDFPLVVEGFSVAKQEERIDTAVVLRGRSHEEGTQVPGDRCGDVDDGARLVLTDAFTVLPSALSWAVYNGWNRCRDSICKIEVPDS
jgi:hypothetical protein